MEWSCRLYPFAALSSNVLKFCVGYLFAEEKIEALNLLTVRNMARLFLVMFAVLVVSTMLLDGVGLGNNSKINLKDADFKRLKAHWDDINDWLVYNPGVYLALLDNYRVLGWHSDEDDCYYGYRRLDQAGKGIGLSKAVDILAWLSCGYGVRPSSTVAWAILTILAFALIFWKGDGIRRSAKPLQGPFEKASVPEREIFRNALFFSTYIFLSQGIIDFLPVGKHRYYVIIEDILGGFFWLSSW